MSLLSPRVRVRHSGDKLMKRIHEERPCDFLNIGELCAAAFGLDDGSPDTRRHPFEPLL
jgi:hypothetical protein